MKKLRLLLVGFNYYPSTNTGDKNFWLNLVNLLKLEVESITIVSFVYKKGPMLYQNLDNNIYYIQPFYNKDIRNKHLKVIFVPLERTITFLKAFFKLIKIIKKKQINVVHFIDFFGPLVFFIKYATHNVYITHSAIGSFTSGILYEIGLKLSLYNIDKIITFSNAMKLKLTNIGIPTKKITTIRWGVQVSSFDQNFLHIKKNKYDISPDSKVVLWSGFLQQTNYYDFLISIKAARQIAQINNKCHFIFAFKPEHFKINYLRYGSEKITIITNANIIDLFKLADIFLSPITTKNTIVAPPLTWLEAMSYGIPVLTTNVRGINEVIINNLNGFVAEINDIPVVINRYLLCSDPMIKKNAIIMVNEKYNVKHSAKEYLNLWENMIHV